MKIEASCPKNARKATRSIKDVESASKALVLSLLTLLSVFVCLDTNFSSFQEEIITLRWQRCNWFASFSTTLSPHSILFPRFTTLDLHRLVNYCYGMGHWLSFWVSISVPKMHRRDLIPTCSFTNHVISILRLNINNHCLSPTLSCIYLLLLSNRISSGLVDNIIVFPNVLNTSRYSVDLYKC